VYGLLGTIGVLIWLSVGLLVCCHEQRIFAAIEQRNFAGVDIGLSKTLLTCRL
jgi:hypothetical protein